MPDQNTSTLLAVLIGGLLSALGGFLANYYMQSSSDQLQKRKEIRNLIEQIYKSTQKIHDLCNKLSEKKIPREDTTSVAREIASEIQEVMRRVKLYLPILANNLKEYQETVENYVNDRIDPPTQLSMGSKETSSEDLSTAQEIFTSSLTKLLQEKGYSYFRTTFPRKVTTHSNS